MKKILLDTDIGCDMDDMQALAYLLARDDAEILGITTVTGEAAVRAELADMMCRLAEKKVPVYVGYSRTLKGEMFIQRSVSEGEKALLGEFPHGEYSEDNPSAAIDFLHETIAANPGEITLCAIGPLTNIAKLFERYPDTPQKLGKLIIMGGRFGAVDTKRWGEEEWNIINDIDAAKAVFETPVPDVAAFGVELTSLVYRTDVLKLSEESEKCRMLIPFSHAIRTSKDAWYHDAVAIAALFFTDGMEFERGRINVTPTGGTQFTQCADGNVLLLTELDTELFLSHFYSVTGISR